MCVCVCVCVCVCMSDRGERERESSVSSVLNAEFLFSFFSLDFAPSK